jgi:hypothetical protein
MDPTSSLYEDFADLSVHDQSKNPPHDSRVSDERDRFTDIDHNLLDELVLRIFSSDRQFNKDPDWPGLLSVITLDERLVTLTPQESQKVLTREPVILVVLQNAWKEASFKEVRRLSEFSVATQSLFKPLIIIEDALWPKVQETRRWFFPSVFGIGDNGQ